MPAQYDDRSVRAGAPGGALVAGDVSGSRAATLSARQRAAARAVRSRPRTTTGEHSTVRRDGR
ncbi:hypothetical protein EF879_09430 [Micromonospora sp. HM5-17]|nr:hypothetical protein EF879_09430 [Micromonospora sp. HM5-17]